MGMIQAFLAAVFGGGRNVIVETAGAFAENEEAAAERRAAYGAAALAQFAAEFAVERKGGFDRFMDGLNRVPRPAMALGTLALFAAALIDPVWFSARMQGIALVPEPLWWLMGAIVSFYFGARYQAKAQDFQASLAASVGRARDVAENIASLNAIGEVAGETPQADDPNPALDEWRSAR